MTRSLPITIVQNEIHWHDISHNLDAAHELLHDVRPNGLIVLPETFATGFIVNNLPSDNSAQIIEWMQQLAVDQHSAVTGSVAVHESGKWYNRLYFITPDGIVGTYDKRHLFPTSPEPELVQIRHPAVCRQLARGPCPHLEHPLGCTRHREPMLCGGLQLCGQ